MKTKLIGLLLAGALFAAGWTSAQATRAAQKPTHYERDAAEMDRTQELVCDGVRAMNAQLKQIARGVTLATLDDPEKKREQEMQKTLGPVLQEATLLIVQNFLLCIDSAADENAQSEAAILAF